MHLLCPNCKRPLLKQGKIYSCALGHSFDIARQGYVNLLLSAEKKSVDPGDNQEMIHARRIMMEKGYYRELIKVIKSIIEDLPHEEILDLGCGEGTILRALKGIGNRTGMDISRHGVSCAAGADKEAKYVVGSIVRLPFENESADVIINCFAPFCAKEFSRVLKKEGRILKITPAPDHLMELKEAIYEKAYLNETDEEEKDFCTESKIEVKDKITVSGESMLALLKMTPYFYKTPQKLLEDAEKKSVETTLSFTIRVWKKRGKDE